ncbi:zonular occludens toxin domain-containing protein [Nitrincola sp.]|uniref:zonular occludens toxin domain-containing protein n=1 Tax=Nitrincola sp. TaxID=1926584 RepID=UPI003A9202D1
MSITIHHGANGSFKTAGVINDYFIPAALEGRTVVTNIRGVSRSRTLLNLPDASEDLDVIYIDTDTSEGRWKIATWFHWVPLGALLLFDEAGVMFPKIWTKTDTEKLNYPGGVDAASDVGRPSNWVEAWEMHRHFNWDIVLTAPNIKSIRDDIRQTTEGAYKHKNKAVLGPLFKGYKEGYHDAQKNGQSATDFDNIVDKRVTNTCFRLYDPTKTGKAKNTLNGFNLFKSPRVLFPMVVALGAFSFAIGNGGYQLLFEKADLSKIENLDAEISDTSVPADQATNSPGEMDSYQSLAEAFNSLADNVDDIPSNQAGNITMGPLQGSVVYIAGDIQTEKSRHYAFHFVFPDQTKVYTSQDLLDIGYKVTSNGSCSADIHYSNQKMPVTCVYIARR